MIDEEQRLTLSGARFEVCYEIAAGDRQEAKAIAEAIAVEQTVEFPVDLLADPGDIRRQIVGQVGDVVESSPRHFRAVVSFAVETAGAELTQLLNVLFGNTSLKPGIRALELSAGAALLAHYRGPRHGIAGLRQLTAVTSRPLVCTALKPMGLSAARLAHLAEAYTLGGIDLIKDDHGLADQPFCRFEERVGRCAEAIARARPRSGARTLYLANVSAGHETVRRARRAKALGADGVMVAPGLCGFDTMRALADDDALALPVVAHPALLGGWIGAGGSGIAHELLLGTLMRLSGADACIFPTYGGRFSFSEAQCAAIATTMRKADGRLSPIFPIPAGGIQLSRLEALKRFYGQETIFLVGGDLHRDRDLAAACRRFIEAASR